MVLHELRLCAASRMRHVTAESMVLQVETAFEAALMAALEVRAEKTVLSGVHVVAFKVAVAILNLLFLSPTLCLGLVVKRLKSLHQLVPQVKGLQICQINGFFIGCQVRRGCLGRLPFRLAHGGEFSLGLSEWAPAAVVRPHCAALLVLNAEVGEEAHVFLGIPKLLLIVLLGIWWVFLLLHRASAWLGVYFDRACVLLLKAVVLVLRLVAGSGMGKYRPAAVTFELFVHAHIL